SHFHKTQKEILIKILLQVFILSLWYIVMVILFGKEFIQVHFNDHLLRRITSSIESHFGARTFYIDILLREFGLFLLSGLLGVVLLCKEYLSKKRSLEGYVHSLFFIPWFIFLNLTKTKIDWYIYPVIPQILFLIVYPLMLFARYKKILYIASIIVGAF